MELRYRSPLEGNEDSDDGLDDEDDEEFIPNVGLVSLTLDQYQFGWEILKMVGPTEHDFWPKINIPPRKKC